MKVIRFDKSKIFEWDEFVAQAKNGLYLFYRSYMDYHEQRFIDHSLMIYKKEKLIAIFPANEKDQKICSHAGLTFGGLVMSYDLKSLDTILIFEEIIKYYQSAGMEEMNYKAIPSIFHKYPSQEDLYALFRNNAVVCRRDISSSIHLPDRISFSESKRQAIAKCIQSKISISENDDFSDYWKLLSAVLKKFNTKPVHSLQEIHLLKSRFPEKIRLFEARRNEELLAGVVIYDYGKVVHTQYMANSENGRKIGALDYANFKLITEIFKDREFYSFGTSSECEGQVLNEGLIQQKELMGARAIVNDFYKIKF